MKDYFRLIDKYKYVSFDIYDTLISRYTVCPHDVFRIVEDRYNSEYDRSIDDFLHARIDAESTARSDDPGREVTLDGIYEKLKGFSDHEKRELMKIESEIEKNICHVKYSGAKLFEYCKTSGKHIILISDMYLPRDVIEKSLTNCGITGYDELFISSECGSTKSNGELFKHVCKSKQIKPRELLHFGDNIISDYLRAKQKGVKAVRIKHKTPKRGRNVYADLLSSFIDKNRHFNNDYKRFGYCVFGPMLYGFCVWLKRNIDCNAIRKIFFLSRDGYIIKRVFDLLFGVDNSYLYVSRRSLRVPMLEDASYKDACDLLPLGSKITYREVFEAWGLDEIGHGEADSTAICLDTLIDRNKIYDNRSVENIFIKNKEQIALISQKEKENLIGYLEQENVSGKLAVVDIGWNGSMQNALTRILPSADIHGFYVGIADGAKKLDTNVKSKMGGYVFDCLKGDSDIKNPFVGMFEMLFLSQEGSTFKYKFDSEKKRYEPILYDYECNANDAKNISEIQSGAIEFCEQFNGLISALGVVFPDELLYRRLIDVGLRPSLKEAKLIGDISFYDGRVYKLASPRSFIYYLFHPKKFKSDFIGSRWKTAFLKRLFKLPLGYDKLYYLLKRVGNE